MPKAVYDQRDVGDNGKEVPKDEEDEDAEQGWFKLRQIASRYFSKHLLYCGSGTKWTV